MYWRKTTGARVSSETEWRTIVENIRQPAGDTQTLSPRPRPATWTVAVAVKPAGRRRNIWVFLIKVRQWVLFAWNGDRLITSLRWYWYL